MSLSRRQLANAIRALSMDAVQAAQSGHPGAPLGMADIAQVLWHDVLKHNPADPNWSNRDRFVLSNGHGSMLLYALLHLSGYDLSIEDIRQFRQLHAKTAGHPEYGEAAGIETTTGPLGQGLANAVGMALAEKMLAAQFNQPGFEIVDHYTYVFLGDGCLMEGISHEACSLAGTWRLGKLIAVYDDNSISIDGEVSGWFTDNTAQRFQAYGWQVIEALDGHDAQAIMQAMHAAQANTAQPTLIVCKTVIGYGSPNKQGTASSHGSPLGEAEIQLTKQHLNWPYAAFEIPDDYYQAWDATARGTAAQTTWQALFEAYQTQHPQLAAQYQRRMAAQLPQQFAQQAATYIADTAAAAKSMASRQASQAALEALAPHLPELVGGSADLTGSNCTHWSGSQALCTAQASGNYIHYGVREFAMAAILNGLSLHGGLRAYAGTFLVFMDYCRNAIRMAALMRQPVIYVLTHDSIGLGEDGPTHQPIEHLTHLRSTPNLHTWRPCDAVETAVAWSTALQQTQTPSALALSRQSLPHCPRSPQQIEQIQRGGYVLWQASDTEIDALLIATGSEIGLALQAAQQLQQQGRQVRVVSMPCTELFDAQPQAYRDSVLPTQISARVAIEAGHTDFWYKYVGLNGKVIGLNHFGASGPYQALYQHFGLTVEAVVSAVHSIS